MPNVILAATTGATQSEAVNVGLVSYGGQPLANIARFTCPGLAGSETGTLQYQDASGGWHDQYNDGTLQECTATNSDVTAFGPGIFRINKSATASAVAVEVSTLAKP